MEEWRDIKSNTTCLSCLARAPEHTLACKHALCAPCLASHGSSTSEEPWAYSITNCPFCREKNTKRFFVKPATAGVRSLIVEGGGIRGIVPLTFLKELESLIGLPMSVGEHFDIAFGSSSGIVDTPGHRAIS